MSHVTDTFLLMSGAVVTADDFALSYESTIISCVHDWLKQHHQTTQRFVNLGEHNYAYGGDKCFQARIWCGAFNHIDIGKFIKFLRTLEWPNNCWVQVLYQDEDDDGFTLVDIARVAA